MILVCKGGGGGARAGRESAGAGWGAWISRKITSPEQNGVLTDTKQI